MRNFARVAILSGALGLAAASPAWGAVTIGSDLESFVDSGRDCGVPPASCTLSQAALPEGDLAPGGLAAPADGVIVRWRTRWGPASSTAALRVIRADGFARVGVGTSAIESPVPNAISAFATRLPVKTGDRIGIDCYDTVCSLISSIAGASYLYWSPHLADSASSTAYSTSAGGLLLNADIEPDADGDEFGDETQDACPTDATKQTECDPPETTITDGPPYKTKKSKVKFKFRSNEAGSTFECRKDRKPWKRCTSPAKMKRLDQGRHKFKVRATDPAANADPTPAKARFKVVD